MPKLDKDTKNREHMSFMNIDAKFLKKTLAISILQATSWTTHHGRVGVVLAMQT